MCTQPRSKALGTRLMRTGVAKENLRADWKDTGHENRKLFSLFFFVNKINSLAIAWLFKVYL